MTAGLVHLRAGGCSVVLAPGGAGLPQLLHWGAALPDVPEDLAAACTPAVARGTLDATPSRGLLRRHGDGWFGRAGLWGHRDGRAWSPRFADAQVERTGEQAVSVAATDRAAGLALAIELELSPSGLLRLRQAVRNVGESPYALSELTSALPLPAHATEVLDFTGHWARERAPQRHPLGHGAWVRESRRGRPGHDATLGLVVGTPGFGFRSGEVWAAHVAWSGNHVVFAERGPSGEAVLGGGEGLFPGEVELEPGHSYQGPWLCAAYSARGLDGIAHAFHGWLRARRGHPARPRPVVLNTWEAVYFDHDLERLARLADDAAAIGVERFVLDDGWFRHRRDDTAGLGDWYVDEEVWPDGLGPLIERVHGHGMEFGLWVEPEMVNEDSDLFRAHPDWILRAGDEPPLQGRGQHVLDLAEPGAYAYLRGRLGALLGENAIDFLKWDHNRDLVEAGHAGRPAGRLQTLAVYRLLDELRAEHPGLEIESCAGGGGRIDLEILEHTDRVWTSDSNDALERQGIQRWTGLFVAPELLGGHVGPARSETSGRVQSLSFRTATALFGHAGIEWDISAIEDEERAALAAWIALYKRVRGLLHTGEVVHADHPDEAALVHGVVATDGSEALFAYVQLAGSRSAVPAPARLPGLAPERRYRVTPLEPAPETIEERPPPWYEAGAFEASGEVLEGVGLALPVLAPEQALLLEVRAAGE